MCVGLFLTRFISLPDLWVGTGSAEFHEPFYASIHKVPGQFSASVYSEVESRIE